jgi:hypothetical protein
MGKILGGFAISVLFILLIIAPISVYKPVEGQTPYTTPVPTNSVGKRKDDIPFQAVNVQVLAIWKR